MDLIYKLTQGIHFPIKQRFSIDPLQVPAMVLAVEYDIQITNNCNNIHILL